VGLADPPADPEQLLERVQALSEAVDALPDPRARELASELVSAVIAMYGDGLERIVTAIDEAGESSTAIMDRLAQDGAVSSLLLIHDLYPVDLHERVIEALDTVRPYMESHGGNVELLSLTDGVARLALRGSCNGCAASRATLEQAIEQALAEHAPDLAGLEVEGVVDAVPIPGAPAPSPAPNGGCELPMAAPGAYELPMVRSGPGA
jgi:Fe-S cluster biogenesis protein NfuA